MPSLRHRSIAVLAGLAISAALSATLFAPSRTGDLGFFIDAFRAMVGDEGMRVYAERPNIQSGPLALLAVGLLTDLGDWAFPLAVGILYIVAMVALFRTVAARERDLLVLGIGGLIALFWWRTFAFQGHLDDAAVITIAVLAVVAIERHRHLGAAVAFGFALAIKPWAVFLLPIAMRPNDPWRRRVLMPCISLAIGGLNWAPFLLASRDTMGGAKPTVWVAPDSVLRLITGSHSSMPTSMRLLQVTICLVAVAWVTLRGHAASALLLGVSLRLLLDGGTWPYYTAGLIVGALLWDVLESDYRLPWATIAATAMLPKPTWIEPAEVRALMRLVACLAGVALVLWTVRRSEAGSVERGSVEDGSVEGGDRAERAGEDRLVEHEDDAGGGGGFARPTVPRSAPAEFV